MIERISRRVKETRDADFIARDGKGNTVNRLESVFNLGTSHMDNEEWVFEKWVGTEVQVVVPARMLAKKPV